MEEDANDLVQEMNEEEMEEDDANDLVQEMGIIEHIIYNNTNINETDKRAAVEIANDFIRRIPFENLDPICQSLLYGKHRDTISNILEGKASITEIRDFFRDVSEYKLVAMFTAYLIIIELRLYTIPDSLSDRSIQRCHTEAMRRIVQTRYSATAQSRVKREI